MNATVKQQIDSLAAEFRKLSPSTQSRLARKARDYATRLPHMRDANGFWRGLSAAQVMAAAAKK